MPSLDTLATVGLVVVVLLAAYGICRTEPGGLTRALGGEHTGRHARPADVPREPHAAPLVRHAIERGDRPALPAAPSPMETVPDVSPFAARTA